MINITVRKLWNGYASVRSIDLMKCVDQKKDLCIDFEGKKMTVSLSKLLHPLQINNHEMPSKFGGTYTLFDFRWIPDELKKVENQLPFKTNGNKTALQAQRLF